MKVLLDLVHDIINVEKSVIINSSVYIVPLKTTYKFYNCVYRVFNNSDYNCNFNVLCTHSVRKVVAWVEQTHWTGDKKPLEWRWDEGNNTFDEKKWVTDLECLAMIRTIRWITVNKDAMQPTTAMQLYGAVVK